METITIPLNEYIELLELYRKITQKIERIEKLRTRDAKATGFNVWKYCGSITLNEDPLTIQKKMRNEWE